MLILARSEHYFSQTKKHAYQVKTYANQIQNSQLKICSDGKLQACLVRVEELANRYKYFYFYFYFYFLILIQFMLKPYILILFLLGAIVAEQQSFKKIIHNTDPKAKCIDGSSPAIYLHQGNQPQNFIIFFVGGGACFGGNTDQVIEACYQRSKTNLGSSKNLKDEVTYNGGYLSTDPLRNKFAEWTKVVIQYCDGALHQGANEESIKYKDTELYFRGAYNTRSHFKYLVDNHNFHNAEKAVITGHSAGGIASFLWNNYVRTLLANPNALVAVSDSGVFTDVVSPVKGISIFNLILKNLFKLSNTDEKTPNGACNSLHQGEQYKCFFIDNIYPYLEGRVLLIQSQYDSTFIPLGLNLNCIQKVTAGHSLAACNSSQLAHIEAYRQSFLTFAKKFLDLSENNNIWTISCSHHGYAFRGQFYDAVSQRVPANTGLTLKEAVESFVLNGERIVLVDQQVWPGNAACSEVVQQQL